MQEPYTRDFAHAKVRVDIEHEVGEIEWLEPVGSSEAESTLSERSDDPKSSRHTEASVTLLTPSKRLKNS